YQMNPAKINVFLMEDCTYCQPFKERDLPIIRNELTKDNQSLAEINVYTVSQRQWTPPLPDYLGKLIIKRFPTIMLISDDRIADYQPQSDDFFQRDVVKTGRNFIVDLPRSPTNQSYLSWIRASLAKMGVKHVNLEPPNHKVEQRKSSNVSP